MFFNTFLQRSTVVPESSAEPPARSYSVEIMLILLAFKLPSPTENRRFPFHFGGLGEKAVFDKRWRRKVLHLSKVSQVDLWCRNYFGVCRGGVCVSDLCLRSYFAVGSGSVCVTDLRRCSFIGVCRGDVRVIDLCRRSYFGVCRGGVCVTDLWRRSSFGVCSGGVCVSDLRVK